MSLAARTTSRPSVGDQADRPVCRDGLPWMPREFINAIITAAHTRYGFIKLLMAAYEMAGITSYEIDESTGMATCPLESHGSGDHTPSLSFGGPNEGRWKCWAEDVGGDGLQLLADVGRWDRADIRRSAYHAGRILGIPLAHERGGRDPAAAWERIVRSDIIARANRPRLAIMPETAQASAFGDGLLAVCDDIAPRSEQHGWDHLLRVRGTPAWAAERCGPVRLMLADELAAVQIALASGPHAAICEAAGILRRGRDDLLRLPWQQDVLLMFHATPDLTGVVQCTGRILDPATKGARYRMPHGHGAALPESIAPPTETIMVRDCYTGGDATRQITRKLHYRARPYLFGLPQVGEARSTGKLLVVEGACKAMAAVAMGHQAIATGCALGWSPDTDHARRADSALGIMVGDIAHLVDADIAVVPDHDADIETRARMTVLAETLADAIRLGHGLHATARTMADVVGADRVGPQSDGGYVKDFDEVLRRVGPIPASGF